MSWVFSSTPSLPPLSKSDDQARSKMVYTHRSSIRTAIASECRRLVAMSTRMAWRVTAELGRSTSEIDVQVFTHALLCTVIAIHIALRGLPVIRSRKHVHTPEQVCRGGRNMRSFVLHDTRLVCM